MSSPLNPEGLQLKVFTATNVAELLAQSIDIKLPAGIWLILFLHGTERIREPGCDGEELSAWGGLLMAIERKLVRRELLTVAEADALLTATIVATAPHEGDPTPTHTGDPTP